MYCVYCIVPIQGLSSKCGNGVFVVRFHRVVFVTHEIFVDFTFFCSLKTIHVSQSLFKFFLLIVASYRSQ